MAEKLQEGCAEAYSGIHHGTERPEDVHMTKTAEGKIRLRSEMFVRIVRSSGCFVLAVVVSACGEQASHPTGPSAMPATSGGGTNGISDASAPTATTSATVPSVSLPASCTVPAPTLTSAPSTAPPGVTITLTGRNFYLPPCLLVVPSVKVNFGSVSVTAKVLSNTQIQAVVPESKGTTQVSVTTVGGMPIKSQQTSSRSFRYQVPSITSISPTSGRTGASVTIKGVGFGIPSWTGVSHYVMVGKSRLPNPLQTMKWTDTSLPLIMPGDFGTGLNDQIVKEMAVCGLTWAIVNSPTTPWLIKHISGELGGCDSLWASFKARVGLATSPGFVSKSVSIVVYTPAGASNPLTFTYKVPVTVK